MGIPPSRDGQDRSAVLAIIDMHTGNRFKIIKFMKVMSTVTGCWLVNLKGSPGIQS